MDKLGQSSSKTRVSNLLDNPQRPNINYVNKINSETNQDPIKYKTDQFNLLSKHSKDAKSQDEADNIKVTNIHFKASNNANLVKSKNKIISLEKQQKSQQLASLLLEKDVKASIIHENYILAKKEKAAKNSENTSIVLERAKKFHRLRLDEIIKTQKEKQDLKPQRLANCLNKPGVTAWMNSASGGRLKKSYSDLPLSSSSCITLREWEPLSGYLGPKRDSAKIFMPLKTEKHTRGYCYKLDPVTNQYQYSKVVNYIKLRKNGISKQKAFRLSQKINCNLYEKNDESNIDDEDDFSDLEKRFNDFITNNNIKEGEIIKNNDFFELEKVFTSTRHNSLKEFSQKLKLNKHNSQKKFLDSSRLIESPKELTRKSDIGIRHTSKAAIERKKIKIEDDYKNKTSPDLNKNHVKTLSATKNQDISTSVNPAKPCFKIEFIKPDEPEPQFSGPETTENQTEKTTKTTKTAKIPKTARTDIPVTTENLSIQNSFSKSYLDHDSPNKYRIPIGDALLQEIEDPTVLKNKNLILKSLLLKKLTAENIEKSKKKKILIEAQTEENLMKNLKEKIQKIKNIEETKKKYKQRAQQIKKINTMNYQQKVMSMKERKESTIFDVAEITKRNYDDKIKKAEMNKKEIELQKAKKLESQRNHYNSHKMFIGMLKSIIESDTGNN